MRAAIAAHQPCGAPAARPVFTTVAEAPLLPHAHSLVVPAHPPVPAAPVLRAALQAGELGKAITQALNATADAAARLNATAAALQAVGREKTSELITLVTKLAAEDEKEAAKEAKQQAAEEARPEQAAGLGGRKRGGGFAAAGSEAEGWGSAGTAAAAAGATAATAAALGSGNTTAAAAANGTVPGMAKPRQEVREALKQAAAAAAAAAAEAAAAGGSGGNLTAAVNVTQMAQAAIDAASTVVASSKATVEQAIEKKKPKVRRWA